MTTEERIILTGIKDDVAEIKEMLKNYPVRMDRLERSSDTNKRFIWVYVTSIIGMFGLLFGGVMGWY